MQSLISNPRRILDVIGWHQAKTSRAKSPFLFIQDGEDYYCLKVSGDLMSTETDEIDQEMKKMILVKRTEKIRDRDIIVGVVDGQPMLKLYRKFGDRIELHSTESPSLPIVVTEENDFRVAGVFVGHFSES